MTTFTKKYDAASIYTNMAAEDYGTVLEITITYGDDPDGYVDLHSAVATMHFPNGESEDYTHEMSKDFDFEGMAIEHAVQMLEQK
jgi:hypothetical protein